MLLLALLATYSSVLSAKIGVSLHTGPSAFWWLETYALWWIGLFGALRLCIALSRDNTRFQHLRGSLLLLCTGLVGVVMFEVRSAGDRTSHFPIGFSTVPYVGLLALGGVLRMISNFRWSRP
jgi:hypothetical protein